VVPLSKTIPSRGLEVKIGLNPSCLLFFFGCAESWESRSKHGCCGDEASVIAPKDVGVTTRYLIKRLSSISDSKGRTYLVNNRCRYPHTAHDNHAFIFSDLLEFDDRVLVCCVPRQHCESIETSD
jgi:hypothetical protein